MAVDVSVSPYKPIGTTTTNATNDTASSNSAASSASKKANLNYDNFLKLLIAQMKNQDPTDPMDASQQVAQLATFSQVEQSIQTNSNLEKLIRDSSFTSAASYLGKTITSADGTTSGVITEMKVTSLGLTAITSTGKEIAVETGIKLK